MPRETNTIRRKDDRDNGIVLLLILFLFLFELGIGFLTYLTGPLLVVGKPDIKVAAVVMADFNVGTTTSVDVEPAPAKPEKQPPKVKVLEIKRDESIQTVTPSTTTSTATITTASTTATSSPILAIDTHTLTYVAGINGSLAGSTTQTVTSGESGTEVVALPNINYHYRFVDWSDGSIANPRTDTNVTDNIFVTANFAYTLNSGDRTNTDTPTPPPPPPPPGGPD